MADFKKAPGAKTSGERLGLSGMKTAAAAIKFAAGLVRRRPTAHNKAHLKRMVESFARSSRFKDKATARRKKATAVRKGIAVNKRDTKK